ncbi:phosphodiester glycosidase family protein, partial [Streptomyces sp. ISL-66]|uniref:phosphodiester glycosidase family protein n=1 Tax=Streptomyces sp. ISL-66 TaxID=2819186 RepID=UPI001BE669D1
HSGGLTLTALGRLMRRLGAHEALNLDGGGSSTLLAALTGATGLTLENSPSDGRPRPVPNGLVLTAPTGSGRAAGYRIEPVGYGGGAGDTDGGGASGADRHRVFPGLHRTLTAAPYDTALGPVPGPAALPAPAWSTHGGRGRIDATGVLRGLSPGPVDVHARRGTARGTLRLEVLGPLTRLRAAPERIGLAEEGESARFALTGYDAQGAAATVEPRDTELEFDRSQWSVADDGRGGFTVTARVPRAAGKLRATVRGHSAGTTGTTGRHHRHHRHHRHRRHRGHHGRIACVGCIGYVRCDGHGRTRPGSGPVGPPARRPRGRRPVDRHRSRAGGGASGPGPRPHALRRRRS